MHDPASSLAEAAGSSRAGFTLIELIVVVLVVGILAGLGMPQYTRIMERGRFNATLQCFSALRAAQDRYFTKNSVYANSAAALDNTCAAIPKFTAPVVAGNAAGYTIFMTRNPAGPSPYLAYTVTFTGPVGTYTCNQADCTNDLLPK